MQRKKIQGGGRKDEFTIMPATANRALSTFTNISRKAKLQEKIKIFSLKDSDERDDFLSLLENGYNINLKESELIVNCIPEIVLRNKIYTKEFENFFKRNLLLNNWEESFILLTIQVQDYIQVSSKKTQIENIQNTLTNLYLQTLDNHMIEIHAYFTDKIDDNDENAQENAKENVIQIIKFLLKKLHPTKTCLLAFLNNLTNVPYNATIKWNDMISLYMRGFCYISNPNKAYFYLFIQDVPYSEIINDYKTTFEENDGQPIPPVYRISCENDQIIYTLINKKQDAGMKKKAKQATIYSLYLYL